MSMKTGNPEVQVYVKPYGNPNISLVHKNKRNEPPKWAIEASAIALQFYSRNFLNRTLFRGKTIELHESGGWAGDAITQ